METFLLIYGFVRKNFLCEMRCKDTTLLIISILS